MGVIEKHLHEHFASLGDEEDVTMTESGSRGDILPDSIPEVLEPPFAKVDSVADNSPAARSGLKVGDRIRSFGYVNHANHDNLKKVAECVMGNEGVSGPSVEGYSLLLSQFSKTYSSRWLGMLDRARCKSSD